MNINEILNKLISTSRELADQGVDYAEQKLDIPDDGPEREEKLQGLKKGAAIGAGLAVLLGTRGGRGLTKAALKLGTLAAAGGLAYKTFRDWQANSGASDVDSPAGIPVGELEGQVAELRSTTLLRAIIGAANADGQIDHDDRQRIVSKLTDLGIADDEERFLDAELKNPASIEDLAAAADTPTTANEIYLLSAAFIDPDNAAERDYLDRLAKALGLQAELADALENTAS